MSALLAFGVGAVVAAVLWRTMAPQFVASEVLQRQNYRGHTLPVASGVVVVLAVVLVGAVATIVAAVGGQSLDETRRLAGLTAGGSIGFGFIGLLDDLVGATSTKGFRGHLGALARGQVTTGLVKLVWGVLLGVLAVPGGGWDAVRGGVLVAACANLGNLFDRAPGRTVKVSLLGGAVVVALGAPAWELAGMALVLGAGLGLLVPDLRERCMLGDTGSNVLGAAVGFGLVVATGATGEWIALGVVVALNAASEVVSFTKVIDRTPPLRRLDRLGSLPERGR
jgi:UDP-N-acetylmuramyl pentapeptide phosphotransferase/UDP-N-acetylglucosamine-1-phosphate transferase